MPVDLREFPGFMRALEVDYPPQAAQRIAEVLFLEDDILRVGRALRKIGTLDWPDEIHLRYAWQTDPSLRQLKENLKAEDRFLLEMTMAGVSATAHEQLGLLRAASFRELVRSPGLPYPYRMSPCKAAVLKIGFCR